MIGKNNPFTSNGFFDRLLFAVLQQNYKEGSMYFDIAGVIIGLIVWMSIYAVEGKPNAGSFFVHFILGLIMGLIAGRILMVLFIGIMALCEKITGRN